MSILNNNKKGNNKQSANNQKNAGGNSKFIKTTSKSQGPAKKVRSTGANRGS